jgi:hypothetical protein
MIAIIAAMIANWKSQHMSRRSSISVYAAPVPVLENVGVAPCFTLI